MERDKRQEALIYLLERAEMQGYVTFDDVMDCADAKSLPIQDFDWLSSAITTRGIIIYDKVATNRIDFDQDYDDYAQSNYEAIYNKIIEIDPTMEKFVKDVKNLKPPQRSEFGQLKYQVLEGNRHARDRMIEMHLRLALKIALQRAQNYNMDIQDAVGEACIGLVIALDKYDPDTNGPFSSYASMWVLQSISRRQSTGRPSMYYPVYKKELFFSAYPLLKTCGFIDAPELITIDEVKELLTGKLTLTNEEIEEVLAAAIPFESVDELFTVFFENNDAIEKDEYEQLDNFIVPKEMIVDADIDQHMQEIALKEQVAEVLSILSNREKEILELRYGLRGDEAKTLEEVGMQFNVTRERIRQIEAKALSKLQHSSRSLKLKEYY